MDGIWQHHSNDVAGNFKNLIGKGLLRDNETPKKLEL